MTRFPNIDSMTRKQQLIALRDALLKSKSKADKIGIELRRLEAEREKALEGWRWALAEISRIENEGRP